MVIENRLRFNDLQLNLLIEGMEMLEWMTESVCSYGNMNDISFRKLDEIHKLQRKLMKHTNAKQQAVSLVAYICLLRMGEFEQT